MAFFMAYNKMIPGASELVTWDEEHTTAWLDHSGRNLQGVKLSSILMDASSS